MPVAPGSACLVPETHIMTSRALLSGPNAKPGRTFGSRRGFKTSARRHTYYQTLSVPRNATRAQIKSNYYKLSKQFHPDLTKDPAAKETFQKISEAYTILGDDRKRRAYDRTLVEGAGHARHPSSSSAFHTHYADPSWGYETRRRPGATHAWEYARRPGAAGYRHPGHNPPPGQGPLPRSSAQAQSHPGQHYDPFSSPFVQKATGFGKRPPLTEADHIARVSPFWRALQVIGIVMLVATLGGGYKASA